MINVGFAFITFYVNIMKKRFALPQVKNFNEISTWLFIFPVFIDFSFLSCLCIVILFSMKNQNGMLLLFATRLCSKYYLIMKIYFDTLYGVSKLQRVEF